MMPPLLPEAFAVTCGSHLPRRSAADYRAAAAEWAETWARPGESPTVALARAVTSGSEVVDIFYRAAGVAHALDTLDLTELVPLDRPNADLRHKTWNALLQLVSPHRAPDEALQDTLQRVVCENAAARAVYLLVVQ